MQLAQKLTSNTYKHVELVVFWGEEKLNIGLDYNQ